jgi:hypothetical protein
MPLTASTIIDQARGRDARFDVSRIPNKVALQFLSAKVRELHGKVARIDPEQVRSDISTPLPLADHEAGIDLGTTRYVSEVVGFDANGAEYPITLIPATHRLDATVSMQSAWQIGSRLYLTSPAANWQRIVTIVAAIVGVPATLTGLNDAVALPDAAELALVELLSAFFAKRVGLKNYRDYVADAESAEQRFLEDVANRITGQVLQTRDVYRP